MPNLFDDDVPPLHPPRPDRPASETSPKSRARPLIPVASLLRYRPDTTEIDRAAARFLGDRETKGGSNGS